MLRLLLPFYSLLYIGALVAYLPHYLRRARREHRGLHLGARLGARPPLPGKVDERAPRIWVHAVSVGEVNAMRPLIAELVAQGKAVFLSTTTETGNKLAQKLFGSSVSVFYFPLDLQSTCRRSLRHIRPSLVLVAETEIWPNFILAVRRRGIPLMLVNGRFSDRSFRRYRRFRRLLAPLLGQFDHLCMQSRQDRARMLELGAPTEKVHLAGNLKYDYQLAADLEKTRLAERLAGLLRASGDEMIWLCGSTREGEESLLLETYVKLRREFPALRWLLAPRHPHRAEEIALLLRQAGLRVLRRSEMAHVTKGAPDVIILDSIGELAYLYQVADLVFIGGSLIDTGGQNPIEPAHFGKPILFGPYMGNFAEISQTFVQSYAALQVQSSEELRARLRDLIRDPSARKWLATNARKVVRENQGALKRTLELVRQALAERGKEQRN